MIGVARLSCSGSSHAIVSAVPSRVCEAHPCQLGTYGGVLKERYEATHGRPIEPRGGDNEVIFLRLQREEAESIALCYRHDRHAPVGALLCDGRRHRIVGTGLMAVAGRPVLPSRRSISRRVPLPALRL